MQIERVRIEDVYPVEDRFGNQYLSRDYSLKENRLYIEELAASFDKETGEPNEPPVLVRDGGIYRIKAGNSRIMAMREIGTKAFTAIIDEKDTPQSLVEAAIRTDTKKAYEPIERSRFEQQLYLFGTDEYVSETTGRTVDEVRKVRRTIQNVEDAAEDMTIERMIALVEFEDDQDAYLAIVNAKEKDWQRVAADARNKRAERERRRSLKAALDMHGIERAEEIPDGYVHESYAWSAEDVPDDLPDGSIYRPNYEVDGYPNHVNIYIPSDSKKVDPEEEAKRAEEAAQDAALERVRSHRLEWFLAHWSENMPELAALDDDHISPFTYDIESFVEEHGLELPWTPASSIVIFVAFNRCSPYEKDSFRYEPNGFIEFVSALKLCGYEPCPEELELYQLAADSLEEDAA